jgi:hypothetical protein
MERWKNVRESFIGKKVGSLQILSVFMKPVGRRQDEVSFAVCLCDCGNKKDVRLSSLKGEKPSTMSCGCEKSSKSSKANKKHGMYGTPTYKTWVAMKYRCSTLSKPAYKNVSVCSEWESFDKFYADMGDRPEGKTLDRIDPYGNYSKENCRWADNSLQNHNQRSRKSKTGVRNVYKSGASTYRVRIAKNGVTLNFGTFNSLIEAKNKAESINYVDL